MKNILVGALALTLLAGGPAIAASHHDNDRHDNSRYDNDRHDNDHGRNKHHGWKKGQRLSSEWRNGHDVDWRRHHLRQPPRGYHWVQTDGDYVLVAITTGIILQAIFANQ